MQVDLDPDELEILTSLLMEASFKGSIVPKIFALQKKVAFASRSSEAPPPLKAVDPPED